MNGLTKIMQEDDIKWVNVANEMLAVNKLLVELETDDISESAEELCSTVNIALDYEAPVYVSRWDAQDLHALASFVKVLRQLLFP